MADDYTPTTAEVRGLYDERTRPGEFDRWLTAHDAELLARVQPSREKVAREWGLDAGDLAAVREAAIEGAAWTILDRTSDTTDRAPSPESVDAAREAARALLPGRTEAEVKAEALLDVALRLSDDTASSDVMADEVSDLGLTWLEARIRDYAEELGAAHVHTWGGRKPDLTCVRCDARADEIAKEADRG